MATQHIIFDYSNLCHRCVHLRDLSNADDRSWGLLAYMVFHIMLDFAEEIADFRVEGDKTEVIVALDSLDGYWRRDIYPPYKADRAARKANDEIDWPRAYEEFGKLSDALAKHTPWRVVKASKCEADDVIYTLANRYQGDLVIIHSGDSDYMQLVQGTVAMYSPNNKDYIEFPRTCKIGGGEFYCRSPEEYLTYAILTGQAGKDNVYNVKTPTDWSSADGKRKPGFGVSAARKAITAGLEQTLKEQGMWDNYLRNKQLIDMSQLPEQYGRSILEAYAQACNTPPDGTSLLALYDWPSMYGQADSLEARLTVLAEGGLSDFPEENSAEESVDDAVEFVI